MRYGTLDSYGPGKGSDGTRRTIKMKVEYGVKEVLRKGLERSGRSRRRWLGEGDRKGVNP